MAKTLDPKAKAALEALASSALDIEMPEDRKKQMAKFGGLFGKYSSEMMEAAELAVSNIAELGFTLDADRLEKILLSAMSMSEKLAYQTRKAINKDLDAFFTSSKNFKQLKADKEKLTSLEQQLVLAQKQQQKLKTEQSERKVKEITQEIIKQQEVIKQTKSRFTIEDVMISRMEKAVTSLRNAETETEREFAKARMQGVIDGQKMVLQSREELLTKLQASYTKLKQKESELTVEEEKRLVNLSAEIRFLREQNEISRGTIKKSEDLKGKTEEAGGGYLKNLFAKSFTGGLHGFLFEGKGMDELMSNLGRDAMGAISGKLGLSKTAYFGAESEEARLEKTQKAEAVMTAASGRAALSTLNEEDMKKLREYRDEESEDRGLDELVEGAIEGNKELEAERLERMASGGEGEVAESITTTAEDISTLTEEATTPGSLYTHDIHAERILKDIYNFLTKGKTTPSPASSTPIPSSGSGGSPSMKTGGGGGMFSGITNFLGAIADGVKKFGNKDVVKGAVGMAFVGASVIPFALGMKQLMEVPWANILLATAGMIGLAFTAAAMGKMYGDVLKGAATMAAVAVAFGIFAAGLWLIADVDPAVIWSAVGALAAISALALGIGMIAASGVGAAAILIGAGLLAVIGAAFIPFALGVSMLKGIDPNLLTGIAAGLLALAPGLALMAVISPLLPIVGLGLVALSLGLLPFAFSLSLIDTEKMSALSTTITGLAASGGGLITAAAGIGLISAALVAFAGAVVLATGMLGASKIASTIGSWLGMGEINILDQIIGMAQIGDKLMQTANALQMIADAIGKISSSLASMSGSQVGMEMVEKLISLDATQIKTLQDVSIAMEKVMSTNEKLKGEAEAAKMGQAVGAGGNAAMMINNNSSVGSSTMMLPMSGRMTDPSILFSSARYHAMTYR